MKGHTYNARKMLRYSTSELIEKLSGFFMLQFDDGIIEANARETIISSFAWDFHRLYPKTPLLCGHHVRTITKGGEISASTHLNLLNAVGWSVFDTYKNDSDVKVTTDIIATHIYNFTNNIYNNFCSTISNSVVGIDILDFIQILEHPKLKPTIDNVQPSEQSIEACYKAIETAMFTYPDLINNPISVATRSGLVKKAQVMQCIGPRGYATDIDSTRFDRPILRGFVKGMRHFHDAFIESRSAAKSHLFSTKPIKDSEYFARKLQILCTIVENLHPGDCGSQEYLYWVIEAKDLNLFEGKYYLDEESKTLKAINCNDQHLIGKKLKIRSPVAGCAHPDPHGICSVCYGELSQSIASNTNLGHMSSASSTQQITQNVLSVKHYDGSSIIEKIQLNPQYRTYLAVSEKGDSFLIEPRLKAMKPKLYIAQEEAQGLTDIMLTPVIKALSMSYVTQLTNISLTFTENNIEDRKIFDTYVDQRLGSFTYKFLDYVKRKGFESAERDTYCIDLSEWDFSEPFISLPMRHYNMSDHSKAIAQVIESSKERVKQRDVDTSPAQVLYELYELVNSKLSINIALLEIIILGAMVIDPEDNDYRIPKANTKKSLGIMYTTIPARSLAAGMAYEEHVNTIMNPASFFADKRPDSVMDVFLKPAETIADPNRRSTTIKT